MIPTDARLATDHDAESQAVALEQVIAAVAGAHKLKLVLLDACRDNPFDKTMRRTIALKLVSKGLSNIEPEAGFMVVYAAKHGKPRSTVKAPTVRSRPCSRAISGSPGSRFENCSTSSAMTSGRPPTTRSSRSPTARLPGARIFTSWRGSDDSSW